MSLHVSEKLEPDKELTISYIDTTLSSKARLSQLWDRYHFLCRCSQCSQSLALGHSIIDTSIKPVSSSFQQTSMEQEISALLVEAKSLSPVEGLSKIVDAYQKISFFPEYSVWLSPLYQVRLDLTLALQANKKWVAAFIQCLVLHFYMQPTVYPEKSHPTRVAHGWVHAKMASIAGGIANEPGFAESLDAAEEGELARALTLEFRLDWGLVVYALVKEVNDQALKSHGPGSRFSANVEREMLRITEEARSSRGVPSEEELEKTRLALRNVASQGWDWLKVWSKGRESQQLLSAFQRLIA